MRLVRPSEKHELTNGWFSVTDTTTRGDWGTGGGSGGEGVTPLKFLELDWTFVLFWCFSAIRETSSPGSGTRQEQVPESQRERQPQSADGAGGGRIRAIDVHISTWQRYSFIKFLYQCIHYKICQRRQILILDAYNFLQVRTLVSNGCAEEGQGRSWLLVPETSRSGPRALPLSHAQFHETQFESTIHAYTFSEKVSPRVQMFHTDIPVRKEDSVRMPPLLTHSGPRSRRQTRFRLRSCFFIRVRQRLKKSCFCSFCQRHSSDRLVVVTTQPEALESVGFRRMTAPFVRTESTSSQEKQRTYDLRKAHRSGLQQEKRSCRRRGEERTGGSKSREEGK